MMIVFYHMHVLLLVAPGCLVFGVFRHPGDSNQKTGMKGASFSPDNNAL